MRKMTDPPLAHLGSYCNCTQAMDILARYMGSPRRRSDGFALLIKRVKVAYWGMHRNDRHYLANEVDSILEAASTIRIALRLRERVQRDWLSYKSFRRAGDRDGMRKAKQWTRDSIHNLHSHEAGHPEWESDYEGLGPAEELRARRLGWLRTFA